MKKNDYLKFFVIVILGLIIILGGGIFIWDYFLKVISEKTAKEILGVILTLLVIYIFERILKFLDKKIGY